MKVNDILEIEIDRMSFGPAAVGRIALEGQSRAMVIFVEGALPGERASVKLTRSHKSYWEAELVKVLRPSPERVQPPCPVFGRCGGCQWQHLAYPAQVRAKEQILIHQLSRATRISEDELRSRLKSHPAPSAFGYRARLQARGDERGIGFFAAASHSIAYTDHCPVAHPDIQKAWSTFLLERPLRELAKATGQFKIEWTREDNGQVLEALNRKHGAFGFTQVNPEQNQILTSITAELAGSGGVLFDLYGGNGNLSDRLASKFRQIISVDSFNDGGDPATTKVPEAGRVFVKQGVEEFLNEQRWRDWGISKVDCVIADPPRNGLREAAGQIAGLNTPRILLVSCDPSTLARDLTTFTSGTSSRYRVERIHLIDMFPQTYHLETVVLLTLAA